MASDDEKFKYATWFENGHKIKKSSAEEKKKKWKNWPSLAKNSGE